MLADGAVRDMAAHLQQAIDAREAMRPASAVHAGLTIEDAYAIQEAWVERQVAAGRRPVGYKLGLTSEASQHGVGTDRPIYGVLFADGALQSGATLRFEGLIGPRVELELALTLGQPLSGDVTREQALAAITHAAPALEIIDNRVLATDPETGAKRNARDLVAENSAASHYLVSREWFDPRVVAMAAIEASFTTDAGDRAGGRFDTVFGSPENALVELARELGRRGKSLQGGDVVLCGSVIAPFALTRGVTLTADYGPLGQLELRTA
jgi:2-oxo-hept-3-ene-1,7-dioate hydratase